VLFAQSRISLTSASMLGYSSLLLPTKPLICEHARSVSMGPEAVSVAVGSKLSMVVAGSVVIKEKDCAWAEATATSAESAAKDLIIG
jgi:hypothetical protein